MAIQLAETIVADVVYGCPVHPSFEIWIQEMIDNISEVRAKFEQQLLKNQAIPEWTPYKSVKQVVKDYIFTDLCIKWFISNGLASDDLAHQMMESTITTVFKKDIKLTSDPLNISVLILGIDPDRVTSRSTSLVTVREIKDKEKLLISILKHFDHKSNGRNYVHFGQVLDLVHKATDCLVEECNEMGVLIVCKEKHAVLQFILSLWFSFSSSLKRFNILSGSNR